MARNSREFSAYFMVLAVFLASLFLSCHCDAKGIWSRVARSHEGDAWYIDQTLAYAKNSVVMVSRAYLKFVPGRKSALHDDVMDSLDLNGVVPAGFEYMTALVSVDCRTKFIHFSDVSFFSADDKLMWREDYDEKQFYIGVPDTPAQAITKYLCLDKSGFFHTLKKQEPFLYLFP
ncbi:MAG: hypothetical protein ABFD12_04685 [Syntrophorhabdus sp.]